MQPEAQFHQFIRQFAPISEAEWATSMAHFERKTLDKGAFFVEQGQICRWIAFVTSGALRTWYRNEKGEDTTSCFCTENHFSTAYKSFILQAPSDISIQALVPTEILVISHRHLQELYASSAAWQQIGRVFAEREYIVMEQYAAVLNNDSAKEKYLRLLTEQPQIIQLAPVQYIASYLGVTRRTLSRIRREVTAG